MSPLHFFLVVKCREITDNEDLLHSITCSDVTLKTQVAFLVSFLLLKCHKIGISSCSACVYQVMDARRNLVSSREVPEVL